MFWSETTPVRESDLIHNAPPYDAYEYGYAEGRGEGFVDHYAVEEELLPGVGGNTAEKVNDGEGEDKKPKKSKKEKKEKKVKKEKKSKKSKKDKKKSKKQRFESSSDGETLLNEDDL